MRFFAQNGSVDAPGSIAQNTRFRHCRPFRCSAGDSPTMFVIWTFQNISKREQCGTCFWERYLPGGNILPSFNRNSSPFEWNMNQLMVNWCFGFLRSLYEGDCFSTQFNFGWCQMKSTTFLFFSWTGWRKPPTNHEFPISWIELDERLISPKLGNLMTAAWNWMKNNIQPKKNPSISRLVGG